MHGDDVKFEPNEPEAEAAIARYLSHVDKVLRDNNIAIDVDEAMYTGEQFIDENHNFYDGEDGQDGEEDQEYDSEHSDYTQVTGKTYNSAQWHRHYRAYKKVCKQRVDKLKKELADEQAKSNKLLADVEHYK